MKPQIIKTTGETLVLLSLADYEALRDAADAAAHTRAMRALATGAEEKLTKDEALALAASPTPLAFWRRKRGLTQTALAEAAGISQSYLAALERGTRAGSPALFKRFAAALAVPMAEIVAD